MANTASLKKEYAERIAPALKKQFNYSSAMQIPVLKKIVINQGLGMATADKKIIDVAINELTAITGQKAVATVSKKDVANFKLRKKMPIGVMASIPVPRNPYCALALDIPYYTCNAVFRWYRNQHVHMVQHQMPLFYATLLLNRQLPENRPKVLAKIEKH